jgi:hypothetical protein
MTSEPVHGSPLSIDRAARWPPARSERRRFVLALVLVALVTLAVFARATGFEFLLWDDDIQLTANPTLQTLDWATARRMFTEGYAIRYQPLSWVSSLLLVRAAGVDPFVFHSYNVVLHTLSAVLVAVMLRRLAIRTGAASGDLGETIVAPAVGALVFALHPLRAEPVAWATGWRYCQSVVLMLASGLLYLRAIDARPTPAPRTVSYWLSLVAFTASALTYPFCLEWPLVLVALDVYPLGRRRWLEKLPFAVVSLAALGASVAIRLSARVAAFVPASLEQYGLAARLMKAMQVWGDATWRGLVPVDLRPVYVGAAPFNPVSARSLTVAALLAGITVLLVLRRRAHPALLALWLVHLLLLGAKLGILESGHVEAADRFTYPAGLAWAGLASVGFIAAGRRQLGRVLRAPIAALVLGLYGFATFNHLSIWRNDVSFFQAGLASVGDTELRDPMLWRLALAYWRQDQPSRGLPLLDEAIQRRPGDVRLHLMRAGIAKRLGREQEARRDMEESMRLTGAATPEEAARALGAYVRLSSSP